MSRFSVPLLLFTVTFLDTQASAQIRSNTASVTLVAEVQESFTVRYLNVPAVQPLTETGMDAPQVLHVLLQWRLREARGFEIASSLETESSTVSLLSSSGFVSMRQISATFRIFSWRHPAENQATILGVWGNTKEKPVGAASLMIGLPVSSGTDGLTVRVSVAIL